MQGSPRVGVGICTRNRPQCLSRILMKLMQYRSEGPIWYDLYVADDGSEDEAQKHILEALAIPQEPSLTNFRTEDSARVGVAKNKNRIIRHFAQTCDYIVIFEDDVYPKRADWLSTHIEASNILNIHHFAFWCHNKPAHGGQIFRTQPFQLADGRALTLAISTKIMGIFMFLSRRVWETVGGFDSRFGLWGYEHVEYSDRIKDHRIGLSPAGGYPSLLECEQYIEWNADNPPSIIPDEEKQKILQEQERIWHEVRKEYFLYRPF